MLQRLAAATGGRYVRPDDIGQVREWLAAEEADPATQMTDLWHNGWTLALIIGLLAAEWVARRRYGLA